MKKYREILSKLRDITLETVLNYEGTEPPHTYEGLTLGQAFEVSLANGSSRTTTDFWGPMSTYGANGGTFFAIDPAIFRVIKTMFF